MLIHRSSATHGTEGLKVVVPSGLGVVPFDIAVKKKRLGIINPTIVIGDKPYCIFPTTNLFRSR